MKSAGNVKKIDKLGRIVLPISLRKALGLAIGDSLEVFTEGENIILNKYEPGCTFCGEASQVDQFKGKNICMACFMELQK